MRTGILLAGLLMYCPISASAQDVEVPGDKHQVLTNRFGANWFVSGGLGFNASYSSQENCPNKNPFSSDRGTLGFDVAVGKWFTPGIGLRTNFGGIWGKQVNTGNSHPTYKYWHLHEDVLFNLTNMLRGYDENRLWNFIPYVGVGMVRDMRHSKNPVHAAVNVGILNNFRINRNLTAFADIHAFAAKGKLDGAVNDGWMTHGAWSARHYDKMVGLTVGITWNFGKSTWKKAPNIEALLEMHREQVDAMNAEIENLRAENEMLSEASEAPDTVPASPVSESEEQVQMIPLSIFFNIGSSQIVNRRDLINVKDLVESVRQRECTFVVTGYADSKTGSRLLNEKLSRERAETIANELAKMGVNRKRITVEAMGGVDSISPFPYNRRVVVRVITD